MLSQIERSTVEMEVDLTTALGTTPEISFDGFSGGAIHVTSNATLTWYARRKDGTYYQALDKNGNALNPTSGTASRSYPIPPELFGVRGIKIVAERSRVSDIPDQFVPEADNRIGDFGDPIRQFTKVWSLFQ